VAPATRLFQTVLKKMNEFEQIEQIRRMAESKRGIRLDETIVGIGDDAAVLRWKSPHLVVTTDCQVEGVHFSFKTSSAEEIGYRLLAVNLSDLAAMGATPKAVLVSLCLGPTVDAPFVKKFYSGMLALARKASVQIVGGNISRSKHTSVFDLTAIGGMHAQPLLRSGARAGDLVAITGTLGDSAAGFFALKKLGPRARQRFGPQVVRHLRPVPRSEFGPRLVGLASSCIDLSDGLSSELHHLAAASGLGFWIDQKSLPVSQGLRRLAKEFNQDVSQWVLHGGEDYQLLFTVSPDHWKQVEKVARLTQTPISVIGFTDKQNANRGRGRTRRTRTAPSVKLLRVDGKTQALEAEGWVHF
jgi:thiamine-monophosphate kinase